MKKTDNYPITVNQAIERFDTIDEVFLSKQRHSFGKFLGVCVLQGCGIDGSAEKLASLIKFADELELKVDADTSMPISVFTLDGIQVGFLTYTDSLFPIMLIERGITIKCYVEASEYVSGVLSVAVSLYFSRY